MVSSVAEHRGFLYYFVIPGRGGSWTHDELS